METEVKDLTMDMKISRRDFLRIGASGIPTILGTNIGWDGLRDTLPTKRSERLERLQKELGDLDRLMFEIGPINRKIRVNVKNRSRLVLTELWELRNLGGTHKLGLDSMTIRGQELLRDCGFEWIEKERGQREVAAYTLAALRFFKESRDAKHFARSLLYWAHYKRNLHKEQEAGRIFAAAERILEVEYRKRSNDREIAQLLHQSIFWQMRIGMQELNEGENLPSSITSRMGTLRRLAEAADNDATWLEHFREMAGFLSKEGHYERAEENLVEAVKRRLRMFGPQSADRPRFDDSTLLRPRVEICLKRGLKTRAEEIINGRYRQLYLLDRQEYASKRFDSWRVERGVSVAPLSSAEGPEYVSPMLSYLPRFDPDRTA